MQMGKKEFRAVLERLIPEGTRKIVVVNYFPEEGADGRIEGGRKVYKRGKRGLMKDALDGYLRYSPRHYRPDIPTNLEEVLAWVIIAHEGDGRWANCSIHEPKAFYQREEELERKAYEGLAAQIACQYNVSTNSLDFVRAIHRHYRRIVEGERRYREDPEVRMERYAGYDDKENFWRDNDYSSSLQHRAEEEAGHLLKYLHKYCPLLMARYEQVKLRRKKC